MKAEKKQMQQPPELSSAYEGEVKRMEVFYRNITQSRFYCT